MLRDGCADPGESSFARRSRALGGKSASGSMISTNASRSGAAQAASTAIVGVDALDAARYRGCCRVGSWPAPLVLRRGCQDGERGVADQRIVVAGQPRQHRWWT